MDDATRIRLRKNGPLVVSHCRQLVNGADGLPYDTRETLALCRCGASKTKPYCDKSHRDVGFTDEKAPDRVPDRRDSYTSGPLTIHDNRGICAHAGHCTDGLPAVWRQGREPWIDPAGAPPDEIVATIKKCPSGALAWTRDAVVHTAWHDERRILVVPGGPYAVQGGAELEDVEWGAGASREHFTLCRCGQSKNKPFCSGAHWYHRFDDARTPGEGTDQ